MLELNSKDLSTRKEVKIDGIVYSVRPAGAGDDMKMNAVLAEMKQLAEKADKTQKESAADLKRLVELQRRGLTIVSSRYDDGGDGTKAFELIANLSALERHEMERMIFDLVPLESIDSLDTLEKIEKSGDVSENVSS